MNDFLNKINEYSDVGGMSITPLTSTIENKFSKLSDLDCNVCIDYFNFNLPLDFNNDKAKIKELIKVLKLEGYDYDEIVSK